MKVELNTKQHDKKNMQIKIRKVVITTKSSMSLIMFKAVVSH